MRTFLFFICLFSLYENCKLMHMKRSTTLPQNTCRYFQYKQLNGIYFGELLIPYNYGKILDLNVNVSMIGIWRNLKLNMELLTPFQDILNSNQLKYKINFPIQQSIPKITEVRFNDNTLCRGDGFPLTHQGVTNLWARLHYEIITYLVPSQEQVMVQPGLAPSLPPFKSTTETALFIRNEEETTTRTITSPPPQSITTTTTNQNVPFIEQNNLFDDDQSCGIPNNIQKLIFNGENVEENEFPWVAALFNRDNLSYKFQCTANLITNNFIITAAHCLQFYKAPIVKKEDLLIILGRSNLTYWATTDSITRSANQIIVHPEYKQFSGHCDIALIKLNKPIMKPIRPICLSMDKTFNGNGIVAGWGKDEIGNDIVSNLKKIQMPIVSQETCLRSHQDFYNLTSSATFCAGSLDGSGPCTGDSGAGFMVKDNNKWYLRGIVSTAIKNGQTLSCNLNNYVVFADISMLADWIKSIVY